MPSTDRVVEKAMALRGFAPEIWEAFVNAASEYAASVSAEMLKHPPETLLRAQGMAIAINEFASTLRDAPSLHEKIRERKHGR